MTFCYWFSSAFWSQLARRTHFCTFCIIEDICDILHINRALIYLYIIIAFQYLQYRIAIPPIHFLTRSRFHLILCYFQRQNSEQFTQKRKKKVVKMQAVRPKVAQEVTQQQSLAMVQNLLRGSVSQISFLRNLFDEHNYRTVKMHTMQASLLVMCWEARDWSGGHAWSPRQLDDSEATTTAGAARCSRRALRRCFMSERSSGCL